MIDPDTVEPPVAVDMNTNTPAMNPVLHRISFYGAIFLATVVWASTCRAVEEAILNTPSGNNLITLNQIEAALDAPMPQIDLPGEVPLSDLINVIETEMQQVSSLPIQLLPDYHELELESIDSLEDVLLHGVFFHRQTHTFRQALDLIFRGTDPKLTFLPQDGHILVTTEAQASDTLTTRVYEVSDVIKAITGKRRRNGTAYIPAQFGSERTGNSSSTGGAAFEISELLMAASTPPAQWIDIDGEGGVIYIAGDRLAVTQTYAVHRRIEQILRDLIRPLAVDSNEASVVTTSQTEPHQREAGPNFLLLAFAIVGWVMAFFLGIVAVFASRSG